MVFKLSRLDKENEKAWKIWEMMMKKAKIKYSLEQDKINNIYKRKVHENVKKFK